MKGIEHLKKWIVGFLFILLIGASYTLIAQETKNEGFITDSKEYKEYVKKVNKTISDLSKIDFAISSKTKLKPVYNDLLKIGNDLPKKYIDEKNLVSGYLLESSIKGYKELLRGCLKGGKLKDSSMLRYLQLANKAGVKATQTAIEKFEVIAIADCQLCKGKVSTDCYSCGGKGKCKYCSGKGCKICDKTQMCIACTGEGKIICPICVTIIFSRNADLEKAIGEITEEDTEDTEEIEEVEETEEGGE